MRILKFRFCCALLLLAGTAGAQPDSPAPTLTITDVVNAAGRTGSGLPQYGIACGSVFAITGKDLGPAELQKAEFPLPSADGLGGVKVAVTVGEFTADAIMVYVSATEVAAILPSATPAGSGSVTLTYNEVSATAPIEVVEAAFGIFTLDGLGMGAALAFNVTADGPVANTVLQPALAGQNVLLNGTGLGAIGADETQTGATDPAAVEITVLVGNREAAVVSAARGSCCDGVDPAFRVPRGLAAWDVIEFTVPEGVAGCTVPVAVRAGGQVSNFATITIAPEGSHCLDPTGFGAADIQELPAPAKLGFITLSRSNTKFAMGDPTEESTEAFTMENTIDLGSAEFYEYNGSMTANPSLFFNMVPMGTCLAYTTKTVEPEEGQEPAPDPNRRPLDAGDALAVTGNGVTKPMPKVENAIGSYYAELAKIMGLPPIPRLPPGIPGIPGIPGFPLSEPGFLEPGGFTIDNGAGGADIGAFTATLAVAAALTWDNRDEIERVERAEGVTVKWSGGDETGVVNIMGISTNGALAGVFVCTENAAAGEFTVPPYVTMTLPPSTTEIDGEAVNSGIMYLQTAVTGKFTAPNLDLGYLSSTSSTMKNLDFK